MKEINLCIGDISRANSSIFTTLDLTSGFWQSSTEGLPSAPDPTVQATGTRFSKIGPELLVDH